MFVWTAKVSRTKLAALIAAIVAVVVLAAVIIAAKQDLPEETAKGATNEERVAFLSKFGWEVNAEPVQTQIVTIPAEESEIFSRYNELQQSQGFDLTGFAGKRATRYVYEILNYPAASGPVYGTVFVVNEKIIGGDITDSGPEGKMQGFTKVDDNT